MADDTGAAEAGSPGAPGDPGMGNCGGFRGGFRSGIQGGGSGSGPGRGRGRGAYGGKGEDRGWTPITKLGRPVKDESEIIDFFLGASLKDEVLKIMPVQKQTRTGQRTRFKVTGRWGSVLACFIPAPGGTGILSAAVPKKLLMLAGIDYSARGCTATLGNFTKATFDAISKIYSYLTLDLWKETLLTKVSVQRTQAPAVATT
uniref:Small ribosomal subunit protein uS5 n=1 Tax=Mandrillus leucophaeus TaxID=9568 RepID=A0A2K5Z4H9_MANLE